MPIQQARVTIPRDVAMRALNCTQDRISEYDGVLPVPPQVQEMADTAAVLHEALKKSERPQGEVSRTFKAAQLGEVERMLADMTPADHLTRMSLERHRDELREELRELNTP